MLELWRGREEREREGGEGERGRRGGEGEREEGRERERKIIILLSVN